MDVNRSLEVDRTYLHMARVWSQLSRAVRRKVGCIVVKDRMIISDGYNGTPSGFDNTCEYETRFGLETRSEVLHAETNAIAKLAKSTQSSVGASMYLTLSPCINCAKLIVQAEISRVIYDEQYTNLRGVDLLKEANIDVIHLPL